MTYYLITFISLIVFYFINNFINKQNFLPNYRGEKHQMFYGQKNVPLSGGIFLMLLSIMLFFSYNYLFSLFLIFIFAIGFMSDLNFLSSPKLRLFIQTTFILIFVFLLDIQINETRVVFIDIWLENLYFKYFFSIFCLLILINGSNFIDGLNGLMLGYFFLIICIIFNLDFYTYIVLEKKLIISLIIILIYLFILNVKNKLFMGDSGSYVMGLICGYLLIKIYEANQEISPFFIILLLWYPCFENLFSIVRKFSLKRSPINADNNHFHQLMYFYIKKKVKLKNINTNNLSSYLIIFYNFCIFLIGSNDPSNTQLQIILITFNILVYVTVYFKLFKFRYKI